MFVALCANFSAFIDEDPSIQSFIWLGRPILMYYFWRIFYFQLNEEFDETTPDGRQVSALVTFEDGKIVTVQKAKKEGQKSTKGWRRNAAKWILVINNKDKNCIFSRK